MLQLRLSLSLSLCSVPVSAPRRQGGWTRSLLKPCERQMPSCTLLPSPGACPTAGPPTCPADLPAPAPTACLQVHEYWSYCGEIESLDCMTFPDTGRFRGIAFITFTTQVGGRVGRVGGWVGGWVGKQVGS